MLVRYLTSVLCLVTSLVVGQHITIVNNYGGMDSLSPESYVLKSVSEHTYIVNEYEPANTGTRSLLDQMVMYGLKSFIDNHYHVFDQRTECMASGRVFDQKASDIVRNAVWIHDLPFSEDFPGFSEQTLAKAQALYVIDGRPVEFDGGASSPLTPTSVGMYTFQRAVYDLKISAEREVFEFLDHFMPRGSTRNDSMLTARDYSEDQSQLLATPDYTLDANEEDTYRKLAKLTPREDALLSAKGEQNFRRNNAQDESVFSQRVVELLEENNQILADYSVRFTDLQRQIDELRDRTPSDGSGSTTQGPPETPAAHDAITITFAKNEYALSMAQKAQLNSAEITLTKDPTARALITGFADKSGNAELNARISKKRADTVRRYLIAIGVPPSRLTASFLGDTRSTSIGPQDRKVEVTFIR